VRKTAIIVRGVVLTLVISSDALSEYKTDADISTYKKYSRAKLDVYSPALENFVSEYLFENGLFRRAFRNSAGNAIISMVDILPWPEVEKALLKYSRDSEYAETEFRPEHGDVPVLQ